MKLYQLTIPVENYNCDGIFEQDMFIWADHSPSKQDWIDYAKELHGIDSEYLEYTGTWKEVIEILSNCEDFPNLYGYCVATNTFVQTKYGKHSLNHCVQIYKTLESK